MAEPPQPYSIVYLSHGGGPLPILGDPGHKAMVDFMTALPQKLIRPKSILVISAHWEENRPTLLGAARPAMFFDYYGFPQAAYQLQYPCPGNPDLAEHIKRQLEYHNIPAVIDPARGVDHGLFIPLSLMYPEATIPAIQLSLIRGLDPQAHLQLGEILRELNDGSTLIIGSGFSFHNMRAFSWEAEVKADPANDAFQNWLIETCANQQDYARTRDALEHWELAPNARYCHPREEHLMPLHVCAGLSGKLAALIFDDAILGKRGVAFGWN